MLEFLIFAVSLVALYYGAKAITESAVHFAKVLGVSEFVIGATVVAFGTALPEFSTSLVAMLVDGGRPEIAAGNTTTRNGRQAGRTRAADCPRRRRAAPAAQRT